MSKAKSGDKVKAHYTGKLTDGTVFDSSQGREPLEFELGTANVIPGFENGIIGMAAGEKKEITIPPQEAYGDRRDELVLKLEKDKIPENVPVEIGGQLQLKRPDGQSLNVMVSAMDEKTVTLDANHPLAGQTLIFDVELVDIA